MNIYFGRAAENAEACGGKLHFLPRKIMLWHIWV